MTSLAQDGIYLMDSVDTMFLYVTRLAQPAAVSELFNMEASLSDPGEAERGAKRRASNTIAGDGNQRTLVLLY